MQTFDPNVHIDSKIQVTPLLAGQGREPVLIFIGFGNATAETQPAVYFEDGLRIFGELYRNLPSGTFGQVVIEYLRAYRKENHRSAHEPQDLDQALLRVLVSLVETRDEGEPQSLSSNERRVI